MRFLLGTLSISYARSHLAKTIMTVVAVAVGVATFSAIKSAEGTLTDGIRLTVDRMAGKAHLQITMDGGAPEEIQERLRELPGVAATAPIIEQIVVPAREELGSILVLGVDLLGDREMRDYGFEGDDADIDDPLVFLAQPDSAVIARPLAKRAGVRVGDVFPVRTPLGVRNLVIRGVLTPKGFAEAFGGNLLLTDVYAAQEVFGRGRRFDRLEVRLDKGVGIVDGQERIAAFLGPAYKVETPDRRGQSLERLISNFTAGFSISSYIAMGIGAFLILNAFQVAVNRRRRDIGTLRSLGATPTQVLALFLTEAALVGLAGGALGLLLGSFAAQTFLDMMGKTAEQIFGVSGPGEVELTLAIAAQGLILGVLASLLGAWLPAREASRVPAVEAFAKGRHQTLEGRRPWAKLGVGMALLLVSTAVALTRPFGVEGTTVAALVFGAGGVVLMVGPVSRWLVVALAPALARAFPVAGQLACDAMRSNPKRTGGAVMATTLSLAFVLGLGGHMGAVKSSTVDWMEDMLTSDLYVRASANWARADFRYPPDLKEELAAIPGVRAVESFRNARVEYGGVSVSLASIEFGQMMERTRMTVLEGTLEGVRNGVATGGKCVVSDNFASLFGAGYGDRLSLPSPTGIAEIEIVGVVRDLSNDRGTIYLDRTTYLKYWKDDRVDVFDVNLNKGADAGAVREAIHRVVAGRYPALVSTRAEFVAEINKAVDSFFALIRITVFLALLIACLGIASSLMISVAERNREIGILKALGAVNGQIGYSVAIEGLLLSGVGLAMALPAGNLMALFMEKVVAMLYSGWTMPHVYPWGLLFNVAVGLPAVAALAAWIPARQAASVEASRAITYE